MEDNGSSLRIAPNALDGPNHHICAFFNGRDDLYRVLQSLITKSFDEGDRVIHVVDPERRADHLKRLADAGVDVEEATGSGQLGVYRWEDSCLREGRFDHHAWLALIEDVLESSLKAGYTRTQFVGQMEWALLDVPGVEDLIEYEVRLNDVIRKHNDTVICTYDLARFSASTVMYALQTHPLVIIGGVLQENPFCVDPAQFLAELRERRLSGEPAELAS